MPTRPDLSSTHSVAPDKKNLVKSRESFLVNGKVLNRSRSHFTKETNTAALSLYHKYQFAETGDMNENEIVLRLQL